MPKSQTTHQCTICHRNYDLLEHAEQCEIKGIPDLKNFPRGLIYETLRAGTDQRDGGGVLMGIMNAALNGHAVELECVATADVEDGRIDSVNGLSPMDTLPQTCCAEFEGPRTISPRTAVRCGTLRLGRMVEFMKSQGIRPLIWNGTDAQPMEGTPYEMGTAFAAGQGRPNPFAPGSREHESFERGYRANRDL